MNRRYWLILVGVHVFALGVIEGLNPYWPIWLGQRLEPGTPLYAISLAGLYTLPVLSSAYSAHYWGYFSDRFSPTLNWIRSLAGLGAVSVLLPLTSSLFMVLIVRVLQGLIASVLPAAQHLALQLNVEQGLFRLQSATAIASITGPLWVGYFLNYWSFNSFLIGTGTTLLLIALLLILFHTKSALINHSTQQTHLDSTQVTHTNTSFFICPKHWFFLIQFSRWLLVPVLASLTLSLSQTGWWISVVYCALPLGMLIAQPLWKQCPTSKYPQAIVLCLLLTTSLTGFQLAVDQPTWLCLLRLATGFFLAPLMPWTQREFLKGHSLNKHSLNKHNDFRPPKSERGRLLGLIQRQQRLGMAAGLILGSFLSTFPLIGLALSSLCYVLLCFLFIHKNPLTHGKEYAP